MTKQSGPWNTRKSRLSIKWFDSVLRFKQHFRVLCRPKRNERATERTDEWTNETSSTRKKREHNEQRYTRLNVYDVLNHIVCMRRVYECVCMFCTCQTRVYLYILFLKPQSQLFSPIHWHTIHCVFTYLLPVPQTQRAQTNQHTHTAIRMRVVVCTVFDLIKK